VDVPAKLLDKISDEFGDYEVLGEHFKGNTAIVAVHGPREPIPRHVADPYRAILRFRYTMAPFSVPERKRPAPGRREIEISKVSREALQGVIFANEFPMTAIDVFAELLAADAGTRVTAITAASVALADAGIPMKDLVAAVAVGKAFGHLVADLTKFEEDAPDAVDLPVAIVPRTGEFTLVQMDGRISKPELDELLELAIKKAKEISQLQRQALKEKYQKVMEHE
jgi:exosome complex component RRP41